MQGKSRPILVGLIGLITILAAVLILAVAAAALFSDTIVELVEVDLEVLDWVGYGGFILGFVTLIIGIAIWRGWTIAWYIAVVLYAFGVIGSLASIIMLALDGADMAVVVAPFIVPLIIGILILYYLFRPKVKTFFGVGGGV
ncbi:MAG: hypothetical protein LBB30_04395 [Candidatus Methanoplasma sp.]|jgi:hypothetical protein|nr:hypothetical protein [Candidatus Methanoplasma sp.]